MTALERRVAGLERSLRRQRRLTLLVTAGLGSAFLLAATRQTLEPGVVQAKRFEVVDERGRVLLRAGSTEVGGMLEISSAQGGVVLQQFASPLGGQFAVNDPTGDPRLKLAATGSGGQLTMMRPHGAVGFSASVDPLASDLGLYTAQGRRVFQATNDASGSGRLVVSDWQGSKKHELAFAATERGPGDPRPQPAVGKQPKAGASSKTVSVRSSVPRTSPGSGSGAKNSVYNGKTSNTKVGRAGGGGGGGSKAKRGGGKRKGGGKRGGGGRRGGRRR